MGELEQNIGEKIYFIRGEKVMLDEDLALVYGVETRVLNQAIRRNLERFPKEFMFKLTNKEYQNLKSQIVTSSWGGRRKMPFAFTEHGAVMLASVLRSKRAVEMSIEVVKLFISTRKILASHKHIVKQVHEIKSFILKQSNKTDREFKKVWQAIEWLSKPADDKEPIGFQVKED